MKKYFIFFITFLTFKCFAQTDTSSFKAQHDSLQSFPEILTINDTTPTDSLYQVADSNSFFLTDSNLSNVKNDSILQKKILILAIDKDTKINFSNYLDFAYYNYFYKLNDTITFNYVNRIDTVGDRMISRILIYDKNGNYYFSGKSFFTYFKNANLNPVYKDSTLAIKTLFFNIITIDYSIKRRRDKFSRILAMGEPISDYEYSTIYLKNIIKKFNDTLNIINWKIDNFANINFQTIDTSLLEFQIYIPEIRSDFTNTYLGNIGQPSFSKRFEFSEFTFLEGHDHILYKGENTNFYNTKSPFTDLSYTMGPNKEQSLEAFHTQNINKYWNAGARVHNISSEGLVTQQDVKANRFMGFSSFNSNRYDAYFSFSRNKFNWYENGGIVDDSYLVDSIDLSDDVDDLNQIPIFLENAKTSFIRKEFSFYHEYKIGRYSKYRLDDTASVELYKTNFSVAHFYDTYNYFRKYIDYEDTTDFYANIFNNAKTFDSLFYRNRLHGFGIKLNDFILGRNLLNAGVFYQQRKERYGFFNKDTMFVNSVDTNIYSAELASEFKFLFDKRYSIAINTKYVLEGYYKGNLYSNLNVTRYFRKKDISTLSLNVDYNIRTPNYFLTNYASNHFRWRNNFSKYNMWESKFAFIYNKPKWYLNAKFTATLFDNYIYFDSTAYPQFTDSSFMFYSLEVQKAFHLWKIVFTNKLLYQLSDDVSFISYPELFIYNSTYFEDEINFKMTGGHMQVQFGFDIFYNTLYYSPAYIPSIGQFVEQRQDLYGDYPLVDLFLNLKIKRMRMFFKLKHLNEGYLPRNYFSAQHYPLYGRGFVMGFSWGFYD